MSNLALTSTPMVDTSTGGANTRQQGHPAFTDTFSDDVAFGGVIGSSTPAGISRKGIDKESIIGIDHGALRIQPLVKPGWGRSGVAYGPVRRENGMAFHALILNGHNISRSEPMPDSFRMRLWRWAVGSECETVSRRAVQWLKSGQKKHMWRRLLQWIRSGTGLFHWPLIAENLAVGWFPSQAPAQPQREGCALLMHSVVQEGGELWARVGAACSPTVRGVQNVPIYYTILLREEGAAYYVSSYLENVSGLSQYPHMRLLAIDPFNTDDNLYAGIHQSVLGEIGFRVDTRVYGIQVGTIPELSAWYGSAHGADSLLGDGSLSEAEIGGRWNVFEGEFQKTARGVQGVAQSNTAILNLDSPTGFVHVLIDCGEKPVDRAGVIWRALDEQNFWCFEAGSSHAQLSIVENGHWSRHAAVQGRYLPPNTRCSLQVYDDGERVRIYLNGNMVYGTTLEDTRLHTGIGTGIRISSPHSDVTVRSFEAHPREIVLPGAAAFDGPHIVQGDRVVVADSFNGPAGDLAGHRTAQGNAVWSRGIGRGAIELTGQGSAKVKGSAKQPCPGRTAYMIEWRNPDFADIEVTITPAGKRRGTREKGRAGLIFWQDAGNYVILSAFVEDWPAMSIAAFFQVGGFEELFDAVWSNVGSRMHWGEPHDFRVVFDGKRFIAYINNEPVLYRALSDVYPHCAGLEIRKVGIVANWEWGNDTGSTFENFVGRDR